MRSPTVDPAVRIAAAPAAAIFIFLSIIAAIPSSTTVTAFSLKGKSCGVVKSASQRIPAENGHRGKPDYRLSPVFTAAAVADASASLSSATEAAAIAQAKQQIEQVISDTDKGRSSSLTPSQRSQILTKLTDLEAICPLDEPARDIRMNGPWIVMYTDAPPPSNGQLGPFKGVAKQVIDLKEGTYTNELYVGGKGKDEDENAWLSAVLMATWKEWDGVYLDHDSSETSAIGDDDKSVDYGATTWRVDFITLTLSLFQIPLFTQKFKAGTARTWKMTYLDDDTRIVRAGKTGRDDDDWIFYMRRGSV